MILLDANIFLRALTRSTDPSIQPMYEWPSDLFRRAEGGGIEVTASDAVIAEVAFILTSKAHYRLSADGPLAGSWSQTARQAHHPARARAVANLSQAGVRGRPDRNPGPATGI